MVQNVALLSWLCLLTVLSLIFAVTNIKYSQPFWQHKSLQYVNKRKPMLLILYTILSSIILFIILPNIFISIYIQSLINHNDYNWWINYYFAFDSLYGSIFCTLINIIAIRSWLLWYDYKFAIATVDRIWRNVINPSDNNFFLNHKNTLGNDTFLLKIVLSIWIFIIFIILIILIAFITSSPSSAQSTADEYIFSALRICLAIPVSIFIFIIYLKINKINDEFNIRREIQYLSYLVCFVTITSIIDLILLFQNDFPLYLFETISYSFDIIFIFSTCYIQTRFPLNLLMSDLNKKRDSSIGYKLSMVDILRQKRTFEAFMRHCVNELAVESLLFLVEVAQYKATLSQYNAPHKGSQFIPLNVQKMNLREILMQNRRTKTPFTFKDHDDLNDGLKDDLNDNETERKSKPPQIRKSILLLTSSASKTSIDPTMDKTEGLFEQFQKSILGRKWLPISWHLNANRPNAMSQSLIQTDMKSKSMQNLAVLVNTEQIESFTETKQADNDTCNHNVSSIEQQKQQQQEEEEQEENKSNNNMKLSLRNLNTPCKPTSIIETVSDNTPSPPTEHSKSVRFKLPSLTPKSKSLKSPKSPSSKSVKNDDCLVSNEWIKDFAFFLYDKYIQSNSALSINISSMTRRFLVNLFSKSDDEAFEYVIEHSGGDEDKNKQCPAAINQQLLINTYMYHIFDTAFEEIWELLRGNSFLRFTFTESYKQLVREHQTKNKIDDEMQIDSLEIVYKSDFTESSKSNS